MSMELKQVKSFINSLNLKNEILSPIVTGILFGQGIAWSIKILTFKVNAFFTYNGNKQTNFHKQYIAEYSLLTRAHKIAFIASLTLWISLKITKKLSSISKNPINNFTFIRNISCIATVVGLIILSEIGMAILMKKERNQAIKTDADEVVQNFELQQASNQEKERIDALPIHGKLIELSKKGSFKVPEYSESTFDSDKGILDFVYLTIALNRQPLKEPEIQTRNSPLDKTIANMLTIGLFGSAIGTPSTYKQVVHHCALPSDLVLILDDFRMFGSIDDKAKTKIAWVVDGVPHWTQLATSKENMIQLLKSDFTLLRYISWPEEKDRFGGEAKQFFEIYSELADTINQEQPDIPESDYLHPLFI